MLNDKNILITGGTGSLGKKLVQFITQQYKPNKLIIFSRDELKQFEMSQRWSPKEYPFIRYFLGDVRDRDRLCRAFERVDYVIHTAALKQVPALEYNPTEAVKTNVVGADNIVDAAIDTGVKKVIAVSTDKAVNPVNLYGATKLVAEKAFIAANTYAGGKVKFSVVRYGNVAGSRASVIPFFLMLKGKGTKEFPLTDARMTRFLITLEQAVKMVFYALGNSVGGEVFIPRIPSVRVVDLARVIEPECSFKTIGIRPGEKLHETLISEDESRKIKAVDGIYVILPQFVEVGNIVSKYDKYPWIPEGFVYRSDKNDQWFSADQLRGLVERLSQASDQAGSKHEIYSL